MELKLLLNKIKYFIQLMHAVNDSKQLLLKLRKENIGRQDIYKWF